MIDGGAVAQLGARLDGIEEVVGSNPIGSTNRRRSSPDTWVIECTGYMGYTFGPKGLAGCIEGIRKFQNLLNDSLVADRGIDHGVIDGAVRPFNMEVFLDEIGALPIDGIH